MEGYTTYAGWAAGLFGITRSLALDLAPIRVNIVSPGARLILGLICYFLL